MADVSKSGVWIDTQSRTIVQSPPVEGRLLVAPGGVITDDVAAAIAAAEVAVAPDAPEHAAKVETVETATAPVAPERAAKASRKK